MLFRSSRRRAGGRLSCEGSVYVAPLARLPRSPDDVPKIKTIVQRSQSSSATRSSATLRGTGFSNGASRSHHQPYVRVCRPPVASLPSPRCDLCSQLPRRTVTLLPHSAHAPGHVGLVLKHASPERFTKPGEHICVSLSLVMTKPGAFPPPAVDRAVIKSSSCSASTCSSQGGSSSAEGVCPFSAERPMFAFSQFGERSLLLQSFGFQAAFTAAVIVFDDETGYLFLDSAK